MRARTILLPGFKLCPRAASPDHFLSVLAAGNQWRHKGMHQPKRPSAYHPSWVCLACSGALRNIPQEATTYPLSPLLMSTFVSPSCSHQNTCDVASILMLVWLTLTLLEPHIKRDIRSYFFLLLSILYFITFLPFYQCEALSSTCSTRSPFEQSESMRHGGEHVRHHLGRRSNFNLHLRLQWSNLALSPGERRFQQV